MQLLNLVGSFSTSESIWEDVQKNMVIELSNGCSAILSASSGCARYAS